MVNWLADPYAHGAYSYITPSSKEAVEELLKPVADKLYLAGEALDPNGATSTVEAALTSGKRVAGQVL